MDCVTLRVPVAAQKVPHHRVVVAAAEDQARPVVLLGAVEGEALWHPVRAGVSGVEGLLVLGGVGVGPVLPLSGLDW